MAPPRMIHIQSANKPDKNINNLLDIFISNIFNQAIHVFLQLGPWMGKNLFQQKPEFEFGSIHSSGFRCLFYPIRLKHLFALCLRQILLY
jgi:hypothetical protein